MSTFTNEKSLWLLGMRRDGRITSEEFLHGIRFARISASRSAAEKAAWSWFDIHGKSVMNAREFYLAVGHLTWYRLHVSIEKFSALFVKMLMEAWITVAETERIVDFSISDYRAGALELIRCYQSGKIDCEDVEIAIRAAVTSESSEEAERVAQQLLFARHPKGLNDATPLDVSFAVACLHLLRSYTDGNSAINETSAEIKHAVYEAEALRTTKKEPAKVVFDRDIPRPMVVTMVDGQIWFFGKPDLNQYRDVAVSLATGMNTFPSARATIIGSTEEENVSFPPTNRVVQVGERVVLVPLMESTRYWITSIVQKVEIL